MGHNLIVEGRNGEQVAVSQSFGLGIRAHDDVMLAYGYTHKITKIQEIPAGEFLVITADFPEGYAHHAESRFLEAYNGILEVKVIMGLEDGELPAIVEQIPAWNNIGPVINHDIHTIFNYRGVHATNPITGTVDNTNTVDEYHVHGTTGRGFAQSTAGASASLAGRHYSPGRATLLVENASDATVEMTYIYAWHEYEV